MFFGNNSTSPSISTSCIAHNQTSQSLHMSNTCFQFSHFSISYLMHFFNLMSLTSFQYNHKRLFFGNNSTSPALSGVPKRSDHTIWEVDSSFVLVPDPSPAPRMKNWGEEHLRESGTETTYVCASDAQRMGQVSG